LSRRGVGKSGTNPDTMLHRKARAAEQEQNGLLFGTDSFDNWARARVLFYAVLRKTSHAQMTVIDEGNVHPRRSIANSSRAAGTGSISVLG